MTKNELIAVLRRSDCPLLKVARNNAYNAAEELTKFLFDNLVGIDQCRVFGTGHTKLDKGMPLNKNYLDKMVLKFRSLGKDIICDECGKKFNTFKYVLGEYAYKKDGKIFCSYSCLKKYLDMVHTNDLELK